MHSVGTLLITFIMNYSRYFYLWSSDLSWTVSQLHYFGKNTEVLFWPRITFPTSIIQRKPFIWKSTSFFHIKYFLIKLILVIHCNTSSIIILSSQLMNFTYLSHHSRRMSFSFIFLWTVSVFNVPKWHIYIPLVFIFLNIYFLVLHYPFKVVELIYRGADLFLYFIFIYLCYLV